MRWVSAELYDDRPECFPFSDQWTSGQN